MKPPSALARDLARNAAELFGTKPRLKGKPATAVDPVMRGFLQHVCGDAYSWHPDYQLPESAEYQFRLNQAHGFFDGKRLVGYWGKFQAG